MLVINYSTIGEDMKVKEYMDKVDKMNKLEHRIPMQCKCGGKLETVITRFGDETLICRRCNNTKLLRRGK
jgi:hypothetical protein